jgi:hypothetical protein
MHTLNAKKNDAKKQHIFAETGLYESVGSLPVMPSLLPHALWGRNPVPIFSKCGEPCKLLSFFIKKCVHTSPTFWIGITRYLSLKPFVSTFSLLF